MQMNLIVEVFTPEDVRRDLCPIIFLHDMFDSRKTWSIVAPLIAGATRRRAFCMDARNHGDSPRTPYFSLQLMADDIREFLRKCGNAKVILVGSIMGGSVAMRIALQSPDLIEKLVVESMVPEPYSPYGWKLMFVKMVMLKTALREIPHGSSLLEAKRAVANVGMRHFSEVGSTVDKKIVLDAVPIKEDQGTFKWEANFEAIKNALHRSEGFDSGLNGTYNGEVLFLFGVQSNCTAGDDAKIQDLFPRAVRTLVNAASYFLHAEKPVEFVNCVVQFINGQYVPELVRGAFVVA